MWWVMLSELPPDGTGVGGDGMIEASTHLTVELGWHVVSHSGWIALVNWVRLSEVGGGLGKFG